MKVSDETRKRIIEAYMNLNIPKKEIARTFGIKISTIYAILKIYETEGRVEKKLRGGVRRKSISIENSTFIKQLIEEDCGITLSCIKQKLFEKFNINVSISTISKYINEFNFSFKRVSLIPERRNDAQNIEDRAVYARNYLSILGAIDDANIIFVDEVGFNVSMRTLYGRSLIGTRANHQVRNIKTRNISVCCAISKTGVIKYTAQNSAFNTQTFQVFMEELVLDVFSRDINQAVFIMDNVRFHKVSAIRNLIENKGYNILYLPPYSPFLNPIENAFSKWKQNIRQNKPINEEHLLELISNVYNIINNDDCAGFFRNMMVYILKSIEMVPILEG